MRLQLISFVVNTLLVPIVMDFRSVDSGETQVLKDLEALITVSRSTQIQTEHTDDCRP